MKKYLVIINWASDKFPFGLIDCQIVDEEELKLIEYAFDNSLDVEVSEKVIVHLKHIEYNESVYVSDDEDEIESFEYVFGESFGNCDLISDIIEASIEHKRGNYFP